MTALNQTQIDQLQVYVNFGDRIQYWTKLAEFQELQGQDVRYANLALGVAEDNTASGQLANIHLRTVALSENVTLSPQKEYDIGVDLIIRDLDARKSVNGNDIDVTAIRDYHRLAFAEESLPPSAWTAYNILEALGDDAWDEILEAKNRDDWLNISVSDLSISAQMLYTANFSSDATKVQASEDWLNDVFGSNVISAASTAIEGSFVSDAAPIIGTLQANDIVNGTTGSDILLGASGKNLIFGYQGNDTIYGSAGNDYLSGGVGHDTVIYTGNFADYTFSSGKTSYTVTYGATTDVLASIERIEFADGVYENGNFVSNDNQSPIAEDDIAAVAVNSNVTINVLDNDFDPNDADTVSLTAITTAANGAAQISNGSVIYTPNNGFSGVDTLTYTVADGDGLTATGIITVVVGGALTAGTSGDDTLTGSASDDVLDGQAGDDTLTGAGSADILYGGDDDDILNGEAGDDTLYGGEGDDTFFGNSGDDDYHGGSGNDKYNFDLNTATGTATIHEDNKKGADTVYLTNVSGGDRIEFVYDSGSEQINASYFDNALGFADFTFSFDASAVENGSGIDSISIDGDKIYGALNIVNAAKASTNDTFVFDIDTYETAGYPALLPENANGAITPANFDSNGGMQIYAGFSSSVSILEKTYADETFHALTYTGASDPNALTSASAIGYIKQLDFKDGISIDDIRLTVNANPNATLQINLDSLGFSYDYDSFEDGYQVTGYQLQSTSDFEGAGITQGSGNEYSIVTDNPLDWAAQPSSQTHFFETITFQGGGEINLKGVLTFEGTQSSEVLYGLDRADRIVGYAGDDVIEARDGADIIIGGLGVDTLQGGAGDDIYQWSVGDGNDIVQENTNDPLSGFDTLELSGVTVDDLRFETDVSGFYGRYDLKIHVGNELITIKDQYRGDSFNDADFEEYKRVEMLVLEDGSTFDLLQGLRLEGTNIGEQVFGLNLSDDLIYGYYGDDSIYGKAGDDTLIGGIGNDYVHGEDGDDTYVWSVGDGNDIFAEVSGGTSSGNDQIRLHAVSEDDIRLEVDVSPAFARYDLKIHVGNETITVQNQYRSDQLQNTTDDHHRIETILLDDGTVIDLIENLTLRGTSAGGQILGINKDDIIIGLDGADYLVGKDGDDILIGGLGNDAFAAGAGNDELIFQSGFGNDEIYDFATGDQLNFAALTNVTSMTDLTISTHANGSLVTVSPTETILVYGINASNWTASDFVFSYQGTATGNTINATDAWDVLYGYAGQDFLHGMGGNDTIYGGDDRDRLYGETGDDTLYGEAGVDYLYGHEGNDTLDGGAEGDILYGLQGRDTLFGGDGDDNLYGDDEYGLDTYTDGDADIIHGGAGNDLIRGGVGADTLNGDDGADNISGHSGDDTISGGTGYDWLYGDDGDDIINGDEGEDRVFGGFGDDFINGGAQKDFLRGEAGNDIIYGGTGNIRDFLYGGTGDDTLFGEEGSDYLYGDEGNDTLHGGDGADYLYGRADDDVIHGNAGIDRVVGDDGNDTLYGNSENDTLIGGSGDDILYGGSELDTLYGNSGADTFAFASGDLDGNRDFIMDFSVAQNDKIDISDVIDFSSVNGDNILDFVSFVNGSNYTRINIDQDGTGSTHSVTAVTQVLNNTGWDIATMVANGTLIVE